MSESSEEQHPVSVSLACFPHFSPIEEWRNGELSESASSAGPWLLGPAEVLRG